MSVHTSTLLEYNTLHLPTPPYFYPLLTPSTQPSIYPSLHLPLTPPSFYPLLTPSLPLSITHSLPPSFYPLLPPSFLSLTHSLHPSIHPSFHLSLHQLEVIESFSSRGEKEISRRAATVASSQTQCGRTRTSRALGTDMNSGIISSFQTQ